MKNYTVVLDGVTTHVLEATDTLYSKNPIFTHMSLLVAVYDVARGKHKDMALQGHVLTRCIEDCNPLQLEDTVTVNGSPMNTYEAVELLHNRCPNARYINILSNVHNVSNGDCSRYTVGGNVVSRIGDS